ncbi:helix-turn-helix domain-containing protein [Novosphingobium sp. G106]|uniref:helix-turn-helix transcriptional regulator n=1 Tax=Novosphingobium sp. G106 TaxID=2849500 RepID=UPI001C2DC43E|nr:helix-turn-helix domain-containing protein [Novosphingobium sp. G106]MBV1691488.1 helix-turn-helix domain-containing protein [Novosphingobium sp. G106]
MDEPISAQPERLTVRIPTAMAMLGLSRSKFYDLMDGGEVATIKVGRARLVILQSLQDYVARHMKS